MFGGFYFGQNYFGQSHLVENPEIIQKVNPDLELTLILCRQANLTVEMPTSISFDLDISNS